jgi:hypothetical protein
MVGTSLPWAKKYWGKYLVLLHHHEMQLVSFLVPSGKRDPNNEIQLIFFPVNQISIL